MKISKTAVLLSVGLSLLSLELYLGGLIGYFSAHFLSGRFRSLVLNIGKYRIHFHHWLLGLVALIIVSFYSLPFLLNQASFGFFGGMVYQGIFSYPDWHQVLIKKN